MIHGGDIYRNIVEYDFSVNTNFLSLPKEISNAIVSAIPKISEYPDIECEKLRRNLSMKYNVSYERVLCGNGASDIFMALAHGLKPKKAMLVVPSFYGYEHCLNAINCEIERVNLERKTLFSVNDKVLDRLEKSDSDLFFLTNPNNPTGQSVPIPFLKKVIAICKRKNIVLVLDECFSYFLKNEEEYNSFLEKENFRGLIRIRAYTKIFAIPGIRLGYAIFYSDDFVAKVRRQFSEWNVSTFAQDVGIAAFNQEKYLIDTKIEIEKNREYLIKNLLMVKNELDRIKDLVVFPSEANFILVYTRFDLYNFLLNKRILIRNCNNFSGLGNNYYRIAVKSKADINVLIKALMSEV